MTKDYSISSINDSSFAPIVKPTKSTFSKPLFNRNTTEKSIITTRSTTSSLEYDIMETSAEFEPTIIQTTNPPSTHSRNPDFFFPSSDEIGATEVKLATKIPLLDSETFITTVPEHSSNTSTTYKT
jgi:hypothetical protein